jgi:DNA mismatch repair protein MutS
LKTEASYFEQGRGLANFSLLYPKGPGGSSHGQSLSLELSPVAAHDLGLDEVIAAFTPDREQQKEIRDLFSRLPRDPDVIAYRQAVLEDLLANPELAERIASLLPVIDSLFEHSHHMHREMTWLHEVVWRAGELQNTIDCFEGMGGMLRSVEGRIYSEGLRSLQEEIRKAQNDPKYQSLVRELPGLLARLQGCASLTIGVNLDASLRPIQATLLSVNEKPFTDQSLLNRLFGLRNDQEGIAPLHSVPQRMVQGPYAFPINSDLGWAADPLMIPLFADLAKVLEKTAIPMADQLSQYAGLHGKLFMGLRQALLFYLGAIRFIRRFQKLGLSMCQPQIAPVEERRCEVKGSYNVHLVLKHLEMEDGIGRAIVENDIPLGADGHILILTGPNRGGKTTYMQGAGVVHILAQAGCYVPGKQALISPLDHLFTHFPLEEKPDSDAGRFGEEAIRLGKIFEQVTRHSLVLLNESLSSTSFGESLYLAQDIVRILRRLGARAIYSTHLHELANRVDELNDSVPGDSRIVSVVSSPIETAAPGNDGEGNRTYKLEMRPPLGQSYAREIAARYGISYQQLENVLSERGVLNKPDETNLGTGAT